MADSSHKSILELYDPDEVNAQIERNRKNGFEDLTLPERAFAHQYIIDYDHRRAAVDTGFGADAGIRLVRKPLIAAYIKALQDEDLVADTITRDFVRAQMLNLLPKLMGDEEIPVVLSNGANILARKFHAGEANALLRELAKAVDFYEVRESRLSGSFAEMFKEVMDDGSADS